MRLHTGGLESLANSPSLHDPGSQGSLFGTSVQLWSTDGTSWLLGRRLIGLSTAIHKRGRVRMGSHNIPGCCSSALSHKSRLYLLAYPLFLLGTMELSESAPAQKITCERKPTSSSYGLSHGTMALFSAVAVKIPAVSFLSTHKRTSEETGCSFARGQL